MIGDDQIRHRLKATFLATSALALACGIGAPGLAVAATAHSTAVPAAGTGASGVTASMSPTIPVPRNTVVLTIGQTQGTYETDASTVQAFLDERGLHPLPGDFISQPNNEPIADGMRITYRPAVTLTLFVGKRKQELRSAAQTVGGLLTERHIVLAAHEDVSPDASTPLIAGQIVQVTHRTTWTSYLRSRIAPTVMQRYDTRLPLGTTRTLAKGCPGLRETTVRYMRADNGERGRTVLALRIIRPRPRIIVRGLAVYTSLAHVAAAGFAGVLHFAGSALHVIATAYTSQCSGCSGITSSGAHAGFGIVAVDPHVIPLGTHLFVPGYGRAVAGDTGGDIHGNRVDLGFNTLADAMRFGRRSVTVYFAK